MRCARDVSQKESGISVGWIKERCDEPTVSKAMGIAALNPSYTMAELTTFGKIELFRTPW